MRFRWFVRCDRLPTPWDPYNLSATPFFHTPLEATGESPHPLSLFVGRERELATLQDNIASAGRGSSRQALAGAPGIGKTTLVKELKARLHSAGYFTTDAVIPILAKDDVPLLFGRILSTLYDTIVANRPHAAGNSALEAAETLVRSARIPSGGGGISLFGVGLSASRGTTVLSPKDLRFEGPRVAYDLAEYVLGSGARGAADLLRDLRDMILTHHGLHYLNHRHARRGDLGSRQASADPQPCRDRAA